MRRLQQQEDQHILSLLAFFKMNQNQFNSPFVITSEDIVFATLYSVITFFGVLGNVAVITIVRKTRSKHTTTDYLLMNLAAADLFTLLFCPGFYEVALYNFRLDTGLMGDIICKLFAGSAVVCIAFDASVLNLCVIAIERFIAVVKPFNSHWNLTRKKANLAIAFVWIMAFFSSFPDILWTNVNTAQDESSRRYPCRRPWSLYQHSSVLKAYIISHSLLLIVVPSIVISFCYVSVFISLKDRSGGPAPPGDKQNTRGLLKLLISLAVAFCVLCLPFALSFLYVASRDQNQLEHQYSSLFLGHRVVRLLTFSNSFVNPVLYAAQSTNYRDTIKGRCCKIRSNNAGQRKADIMTSRRRRQEEGESAV